VFSAASNKREIADKQKMDETNNNSGATKFTLPSLRKMGRASEDPNLPMIVEKSYSTNNNETPINKHRMRFTLLVKPT